ncbi:MAG: hypothetical protein ACOVNU_05100 [Candidatus Kapaibacteriota bacterium]|jgi:hypothetical protein
MAFTDVQYSVEDTPSNQPIDSMVSPDVQYSVEDTPSNLKNIIY